jgi:two-component system sensor histidine kinase BaeS
VQDTGIAESDLPHIFDRFYRAANTRAHEPAGTGLGLAIVRKIIQQHRGHVEVKSVLGEGTIFTVYLPDVSTLDIYRTSSTTA